MNILINGKDFFYCYNPKLSNFLFKEGYPYITKAINPDNNRLYSMYYRSYGLQVAIDKYKQSNQK